MPLLGNILRPSRPAMLSRRVVMTVAAAACLALPLIHATAMADDYPSRPITIIVGYPPGGPTDLVARIMADHMKTTLGQPVLIENVGGASGTIGGAKAARSDPDGYTLSIGQWSSQVGAPAALKLPYDALDGFEPISMLTISYMGIVARKDLPANDLKGMVAWMKANPGKANVASVGFGSAAHVCLLDFQHRTGTTFQIISYKGGAPVMKDLIGGQVDLTCLEVGQTLASVKGGKVKAIAVASKQRWFGDPDMPTFADGGVPGIVMPFWHGLWAPKGTPKPIIDKLNDAVKKAFLDPAVKARFATLGHEIPPVADQNPQALHRFHKAELDKWWPLMKSAGIEPK